MPSYQFWLAPLSNASQPHPLRTPVAGCELLIVAGSSGFEQKHFPVPEVGRQVGSGVH